MSMSTSCGKEAVFYVVSRSGKVLGSEGCPRRIHPDDYLEGELEGWIFWGSKRTSGSSSSKRVSQDTIPPTSTSKGCVGGPCDSVGSGRKFRKKRLPFVAWGDEISSLSEVINPVARKQVRSQAKKSVVRNDELPVKDGEWREDIDAEFSQLESVMAESLSCRWERMERNLKIGLAQLSILHKWEIGTRELAAKWVAWLLKMLRKARPHPRPLQHLLFSMCAAVLPVICRSLARESWTMSPDIEVCKCVDIFWQALEKSYVCFSPIQWEILEEKLDECRKLRMQIASLLIKRSLQSNLQMGSREESGQNIDKQEGSDERLDPSLLASEESQRSRRTKDERLSNALVQSEGVPALVKYALREKLLTPRIKCVDGRGNGGASIGAGTVVSLTCPLSGGRVKIPARGRSCNHRSSFDLQAYLEDRAKGECPGSSESHLRKKQKVEIGVWRCPICGSDASWPHLIVDRVLLRILEVLPESMGQVCLLPNGRWRVVWSPVVEEPGNTHGGSLERAGQALSECAVNTGSYSTRLCRPSKRSLKICGLHSNVAQDICRCESEWHQLDAAFESWKNGIDQLAKGAVVKEVEAEVGLQVGVSHSDADHKTKLYPSLKTSPTRSADLRQCATEVKNDTGQCVEFPVTEMLPPGCGEALPSAAKGLCEISKTESSIKEETGPVDGCLQVTQQSSSEALIERPFVFSAARGMCTRMRVGQHKARRKLMAKKT